jgi:hypothetical protein
VDVPDLAFKDVVETVSLRHNLVVRFDRLTA